MLNRPDDEQMIQIVQYLRLGVNWKPYHRAVCPIQSDIGCDAWDLSVAETPLSVLSDGSQQTQADIAPATPREKSRPEKATAMKKG